MTRILTFLLLIALSLTAGAQYQFPPNSAAKAAPVGNDGGSFSVFYSTPGPIVGGTSAFPYAKFCAGANNLTFYVGSNCTGATLYQMQGPGNVSIVNASNGDAIETVQVPSSIVRLARAQGLTSIYYIRGFCVGGNCGAIAESAVQISLIGNDPTASITFSDVRMSFRRNGQEADQLNISSKEELSDFGAWVFYSGSGMLNGRWEVAQPGDEPSREDLFPEASVGCHTGTQRRFRYLDHFTLQLPPGAGRYFIPGPDPRLLPKDLDGQYRILLRIECSTSAADLANYSAAGGVLVSTGGTSTFPFPVLTYRIGNAFAGASAARSVLPAGPLPTITQLLPSAGATISRSRVGIHFYWYADVPNAAFYRFELDDGKEVQLSALTVDGHYQAPLWLLDKGKGQTRRWRVVATDFNGQRLAESPWRAVVFP